MYVGYKCDICHARIEEGAYHFRAWGQEDVRVCPRCVRDHGGKKGVKEDYELGNIILIKHRR